LADRARSSGVEFAGEFLARRSAWKLLLRQLTRPMSGASDQEHLQ